MHPETALVPIQLPVTAFDPPSWSRILQPSLPLLWTPRAPGERMDAT